MASKAEELWKLLAEEGEVSLYEGIDFNANVTRARFDNLQLIARIAVIPKI